MSARREAGRALLARALGLVAGLTPEESRAAVELAEDVSQKTRAAGELVGRLVGRRKRARRIAAARAPSSELEVRAVEVVDAEVVEAPREATRAMPCAVEVVDAEVVEAPREATRVRYR